MKDDRQEVGRARGFARKYLKSERDRVAKQPASRSRVVDERRPLAWPRKLPTHEGAALTRLLLKIAESYPDTKPANLHGRVNALVKRRAKNRRARASRKANR